jgi:hypothetical protein
MKSELLKRRNISLGFVHRRVPSAVIQTASFGELQLSLGKTEPPKSAMTVLMRCSKSVMEGCERGSGRSDSAGEKKGMKMKGDEKGDEK